MAISNQRTQKRIECALIIQWFYRDHEKKDIKATASKGEDLSVSVDPIPCATLDCSHKISNMIATEARLKDHS